MKHDLEQLASDWHQALPGIARASLIDHGIGDDTIDQYLLGWDSEHITVPVRSAGGRIVYVERWSPETLGTPAVPEKSVLLFAPETLTASPDWVVIAEGVLEVLVLQSVGIPAVSATGSGRYFKSREWRPLFEGIPEVLVALKNGSQVERHKWLLDRDEVVEKILTCLPQARRATWPETVGRHGSAVEFFTQGRGTREEFEALWTKQ